MPYMTIRGMGKIKVKKKPPRRFSKTVKIGNRVFKTDPTVQKLLWANKHITAKERKRLTKKWGLPIKRRKKR